MLFLMSVVSCKPLFVSTKSHVYLELTTSFFTYRRTSHYSWTPGTRPLTSHHPSSQRYRIVNGQRYPIGEDGTY